ncbi:hypothetical protein ACWU7N_004687, partial [Escherichia coli]
RAVHTAGADTGKNGRKFPLRAAGDFRIPFVINTYKPEDQLFVSRIHKERNIQVCAAFNGIVKTIAYSALFDHGLASKSDQRFAYIRSTGNLTFSTAF